MRFLYGFLGTEEACCSSSKGRTELARTVWSVPALVPFLYYQLCVFGNSS
jgi:hypothetical protein